MSNTTDSAPKTDAPATEEQPGSSLISHLLELRTRLLYALGGILLVFLPLIPFANEIYSAIANPLLVHLPEGANMIAIEVASPFLIPFKLTMMLSIALAIPWVLYQVWAFVAPGLYGHEKRMALPLVVGGTVLFYAGMAFAYFVVLPLVFAFLTGTAPDGVAVMTDISKYLDFVLTMFFAFGIAFQVPIATFLMVMAGLTTAPSLAEKRPYIIVGTFVIGMLLTPPDIISQTLLALPMWLLFEIGLLLSSRFARPHATS